MKTKLLTRQQIIEVLISNLRCLKYVCALWEAGAASFNRVDQWSDIDLYLVVKDGYVEDGCRAIEQIIPAISGFDLKLRLPEPTWHGHAQVFYRLKNASPFLFLDIVVMKKSSKDKFLQYAIHGKPLVHFDKIGIVKDDPIDTRSFLKKIPARLEMLKTNFELFQVLILKELNRGNDIEAFAYYLGYTFRPLVEVLRIRYCPYHYNFYTSYIYYDLPTRIVKRLHRLYFVAKAKNLRKSRLAAEAWFWETVKSIETDGARKKIAPAHR